MNESFIGYFLGSSGCGDFFSLFDALTPPNDLEWYTYILKGGPGTGKSTLMKALAARAQENDIPCEKICCASDPDSLDAVIFPELKACVVDGTAPHTLDPKYPGATAEIINLGKFREGELVAQREKIAALTDANLTHHARARRFIDAAFGIFRDAAAVEKNCILPQKALRYAARLAARVMPAPSQSGNSKVTWRLFDAVTPKGYIFNGTPPLETAVVFVDDFGAVSGQIIDKIRFYALEKGYDIIESPSISGGSVKHIIIPEVCAGFFTSDFLCPVHIEGARYVRISRFTDTDAMRERRARLSFSKKAALELMGEAVSSLKKAGGIHDELEKIYIGATDFEFVNLQLGLIFEKLWKRQWHEE